MTLTEFLLARIAEREAAIKYAFEHGMAFPVLSPAEMLAECEAKRRIVGVMESEEDSLWLACTVLQLLALPHADHPDYDESWRP